MQARPAVLLLRSHHSSSRKQDGSAGSQIEIAAFLLPLPFFLPGVILVGGKRKIAKSVYDIRAHTGVRHAKLQLPSGGFPAVFRFQNRRHLEARDPRCTDPAPARLEILCLRKTAGQICVIFMKLKNGPSNHSPASYHPQQSISACSLFRSLFCIFRSLFLIPAPAFSFSISGIFYSCPSTFTPVSSINGPISYSGIWST